MVAKFLSGLLSWQKAKRLTFTLGLKQVVRFFIDDEQMTMKNGDDSVSVSIYSQSEVKGAAWLSKGAAWLTKGAAWLSKGAAWLSKGARGLVRVQRGLVDSTLDCCIAVPGSIPRPAPLPQKTSAGSSAQMICSAQEESPQRRKFNEDESCKILYCKSSKNKN
jgi:hypothetical protein